MNTYIHTYSPFYLTNGRHSRLPLDIALFSSQNFLSVTVHEHFQQIIQRLKVAQLIASKIIKEVIDKYD